MQKQERVFYIRLTRRDLLKIGAGLAGSMAASSILSACGSTASPAATEAPAAAEATQAPAQEAAAAETGGTLVFAVDSLQGNLEPGTFFSFGDWQAIDCVARGLVFFDYQAGSEPEPALAESWDISDDGLVYTFKLKQGLKFHDDTDITAEAVRRSFMRLLDENDPTRAPGTYAGSEIGGTNVAEIKVIDDHTVQISLKEPDVAYLKRMANPNAVILSPAALDKYGKDIGQNLVSAGPFKVERIVANQEVELSAFDGFYKGRPQVDRVVLRAIPDETTILSALEAGEVHVTNHAPISELERMRNNSSLKVEVGVPWIVMFLGLNYNIPPFDDQKVRQAVNFAINRENIKDAVFSGASEVPAGIIAPPELGYAPELAELSSQDLDKAKALLAEAGKEGIEITLSVTNVLFWPRMGELIQNDLNQAGFNCKLEKLDEGTFWGKVHENALAMTLTQRSAFVADPDNKLTPILYSTSSVAQTQTGNANYPDAADLDRMLDQARAEADQAKRAELYKEIQKWLLERVPYVYIGYLALPVVEQKNVAGVNAAALGTYRTYLENAHFTT